MVVAEEDRELAKRYGIMQAPALVIEGGSGCRVVSGLAQIQLIAEQAEENGGYFHDGAGRYSAGASVIAH